MTAEGRFAASDGTALRWIAHEAHGLARCVLLIVHGLSDHADRYIGLASALAPAGIATWAFDMRGHGDSPGPRGHADSFDVLLSDVEAFRRFVADRVGAGQPLFLLGHSMGGLLALRYVQSDTHGLRGVILSAPWLETASPVPWWKRLPARLLEHVLPALPVPAGLDAGDISDDVDEVHAYENDPRVHGRISPRLFREAERAAAAAMDAPAPGAPPMLLLVPDDDRIVSAGAVRRLAGRSDPGADVTVRGWPSAAHELMHSTKRSEVIEVLREWLLARAAT